MTFSKANIKELGSKKIQYLSKDKDILELKNLTFGVKRN